MVNVQAFAYGIFVIVFTLDQRLSGDIVLSFLFGRIKDDMISSATGEILTSGLKVRLRSVPSSHSPRTGTGPPGETLR